MRRVSASSGSSLFLKIYQSFSVTELPLLLPSDLVQRRAQIGDPALPLRNLQSPQLWSSWFAAGGGERGDG